MSRTSNVMEKAKTPSLNDSNRSVRSRLDPSPLARLPATMSLGILRTWWAQRHRMHREMQDSHAHAPTNLIARRRYNVARDVSGLGRGVPDHHFMVASERAGGDRRHRVSAAPPPSRGASGLHNEDLPGTFL